MIETIAQTGSTNADLIRRLHDGETLAENHWLRAEAQSGGRGRLGRGWVSPQGNLYCSTIANLQPDDPLPQTLSFVAGLAVFATVENFVDASANLTLKWPNDVLVGGAKIAGILLERTGSTIVIGIGVNIETAPAITGRKTTMLADHAATVTPSCAEFLGELSGKFASVLGSWRRHGAVNIIQEWQSHAHTAGDPLSISAGSEDAVSGRYAGVAPDGALMLRRDDGVVRRIYAGDIS